MFGLVFLVEGGGAAVGDDSFATAADLGAELLIGFMFGLTDFAAALFGFAIFEVFFPFFVGETPLEMPLGNQLVSPHCMPTFTNGGFGA
jgi:hypothetical protein